MNNESSEHPWIYYQIIASHAPSHQNPFPPAFLVVLTPGCPWNHLGRLYKVMMLRPSRPM